MNGAEERKKARGVDAAPVVTCELLWFCVRMCVCVLYTWIIHLSKGFDRNKIDEGGGGQEGSFFP